MTANDVAVSFGVHSTTAQCFMTTSAAKERPRSCIPIRLIHSKERYIRITTDRDRLLPATWFVSSVRISNRVRIIRATSPQ